jgi:hypothetical protein
MRFERSMIEQTAKPLLIMRFGGLQTAAQSQTADPSVQVNDWFCGLAV